jgi:transposase
VRAKDGVHLTQQVHTMPSQDTQASASRRQYSAEFKRELVQSSLQPGASVSGIALENGINANVLFKWRRLHLRAASGVEQRVMDQAVLLPVKVSATQEVPAPASPKPATAAVATGVIEIDVSGARVRVRGAVDQASLQCVLQALRALA